MAGPKAVSAEDLQRFKKMVVMFNKVMGTKVIGYTDKVTEMMITLLSQGHILLEGVPGTAKTTIAKAFSDSLGMQFARIQFTQDLQPSDITGYNMPDPKTKKMALQKGPVFTNLLLADEVNRAPPKTQSAMLETMEEKQVTIEGVTHKMARPFMVVATMNPIDNDGVFRLPEAQLDRFIIKTNLEYLTSEDDMEMLKLKLGTRASQGDFGDKKMPVEMVRNAQDTTLNISYDEPTLTYLQQVCQKTRDHPDIRVGASPRAMTQMLRGAQAMAMIRGSAQVTAADVAWVAPRILAHRLQLKIDAEAKGKTTQDAVKDVIKHVPKPAS